MRALFTRKAPTAEKHGTHAPIADFQGMLFSATVVVGLLLTGARCQFLSYNPDTYPDSEREWTLCRTPGRSLACDPNQLLNSVDGLEGMLLPSA